MDIQQPCHLCPRRLYQSGKRCTDHFTVVKTPCGHYFHPACWERHYKKNKTTSDASCPCPKCHRMVTHDGLREITVYRDKTLKMETPQECRHANHHLCSAVEETRLQEAAAMLEKRSREKQETSQRIPRKCRRRRNVQDHDSNYSCISMGLFWRVMKLVGKTLLFLAFLALLWKCYWGHVVIERFTTWDEVIKDKDNILRRMQELSENAAILKNMTPQEIEEKGLNAGNELHITR